MLKVIFKLILVIIIAFSILVILNLYNANSIKKNYIPVKAEVIFFVNTKIARNVARTKLTVEYVYKNENKKMTIIAPIYDYKIGSEITIYINPNDENDIRVP
jgi:hypothetical protein